ncbi:MAG: cytochrome c biogenesis protein [Anaerolineae bacterium]
MSEINESSLYWPFLEGNRFATLTRVLGGLALLNIAVALWMALFYAPMEQKLRYSQRIFYFHVPSAWIGFLAFFVVFLASIMYLWKRKRQWDVLALSSAEIGVIFTTLVLLTGPLWAKYAWGVYWVWDARLTSALVLWLIYVSYLMLRAYAGEGPRQANWAAVLGIVGAFDIPIILVSVEWWRTQHPELIVIKGTGLPDPRMRITLMVALLSFTWLYFFLLSNRVRLERARDEVARIKERLGR